MLSFVQNWLTTEANPIGVDFGSDSLRLAQVELVDNEFRLVAAASAEVPSNLRGDKTVRLGFLTQTTRDLLTQGEFRGRRAILGLPASCMQIHQLRLPPADDASLRGALPGALRSRMQIDPGETLLRHLVAGQVEQDGTVLNEVIVMAAQRTLVDELLHAAAKARLDVIAMNVEPKAVVDCFSHVYRRRGDGERISCYIDIGASATRVVVARGQQIFFARAIPLAGDHFSCAVAAELHTTPDAARILRVNKHIAASEAVRNRGRSGPSEPPANHEHRADLKSVDAPHAEAERNTLALHQQIDRACGVPLEALIAALADCQRDHEASFPNSRIDRLIFVGGEACDRELCQTIADGLGIPGSVGDPLVRMGRISKISVESGIDRRLPQPAWAVAIGLSMGPAAADATMAVNKVS
jgi:Tfp pilus assembly PilM family ATPase